MALENILEVLTANPLLLGAIMAIIYDLSGYAQSMLNIKAMEPFEKAKLAQTFLLFETMFLLLSQIGGLNVMYTAIFAIIAQIAINIGQKLKAKAPAT